MDREEPWLRALASHYRHRGGALWVADDGGVAGMIATLPRRAAEWEIAKVYVSPDRHGTGLAHTLLDHAEAHALVRGAVRLTLWTDTRFVRAHRFYERRGYERFGQVRALHDLSGSLEFGYAKLPQTASRFSRNASMPSDASGSAMFRTMTPDA